VALKGWRALQRRGGDRWAVAGAAAAFASTLASRRLLARLERARSLAPLAAYRIALAAVVLTKSPK
jgi:undecaprenyl pyrophosphate phosphatase UppP